MNEQKDRDEKTGQFLPGNPGKPMGARSHFKQLEEALESVGKRVNKDFFTRVAELAFTNPKVTIGVLKKFLADKTHIESEGQDQLRVIIMERGYSKKEKAFINSKIKEWRKQTGYKFEFKEDPNNKLTEEEKLMLKKEGVKEFGEIKENIED